LARHVPVNRRESDRRHSKGLQEQDRLILLLRPQIKIAGDPGESEKDRDGEVHPHCLEDNDGRAQWQKAANTGHGICIISGPRGMIAIAH
jgi:hypothetical protein